MKISEMSLREYLEFAKIDYIEDNDIASLEVFMELKLKDQELKFIRKPNGMRTEFLFTKEFHVNNKTYRIGESCVMIGDVVFSKDGYALFDVASGMVNEYGVVVNYLN